jgi:hypothetical protein
MAYNMLKSLIEKQSDENIVSFVGKDHLIEVTKEILAFLNKPETFASYKRP